MLIFAVKERYNSALTTLIATLDLRSEGVAEEPRQHRRRIYRYVEATT